MLDMEEVFKYAVEAVKIVGGLASFYAVVKLRQIEKRYLFKATVPALIANIENALSLLSRSLLKPASQRPKIIEALHCLMVDVRNVRRKSRRDTAGACDDLLRAIRVTLPRRRFWQREVTLVIRKADLLGIYGKGRGLVRSLENDLRDQRWSGR
jgi:hypothetical protein